MFSATVMRGTVAFFSGSSGRPNTLKRSKSCRVGSKRSPRMKMPPSSSGPLARQHLDQLGLAVAGDAGDADDLAGVDLEIDAH